METPETLTGGKVILPESVREGMTAYQVEVLAVGPLAHCEHPDECERPHTHAPIEGLYQEHGFTGKPGDWVVVAPRSLTAGEDDSYFVRQDDILAVLTA